MARVAFLTTGVGAFSTGVARRAAFLARLADVTGGGDAWTFLLVALPLTVLGETISAV